MKAGQIKFLNIEYQFSSGTGDIGFDRYINEYEITISGDSEDENGNFVSEIIGKGSILLFLIELAIANSYSLYEIFDHSQSAMHLGNMIYDWENEDFIEKYEKETEEIFNSNILYIDRIEILPKFRGYGLGKYVIKDIIWRFFSCCGIIALKAYPLQLELYTPLGCDDQWRQSMKYDTFEQNRKKAEKSLFKYYQSIGFKKFDHGGGFIMNMIYNNPKLDEIDLVGGL